MVKRVIGIVLLVLAIAGPVPGAASSPSSDLAAANETVLRAINLARQGDVAGLKAAYDQFNRRWLQIEDGVREQSKTAYRAIESEMSNVQFALMQNPADPDKIVAALEALRAANERFISGGFQAGGGQEQHSSESVAGLLALLDEAKQQIQAGNAAAAAQTVDRFRRSWLDVEGVVLTQSSKVYADAERDMVNAYALLASRPPNLEQALAVVTHMRDYLSPMAEKTSYNAFDAAAILLREGLEALLVVVALLAFLKKAGYEHKSGWIWGGVGAGVAISVALGVLVKLLIGTGAFGANNFLIAGWSGLFAAVMLLWVSYWLHSKSSIVEWQRYIHEKSRTALASGSLFSLAGLSFLAVFREGTETVLFFIGMASSIALESLLLGLGIGFAFLVLLAVVILKIGLRVPMRPFFLMSSLLVFYLAFKFTGDGIHGLQLAGVLPATVAPYLPSVGFLSLYPNWQSTLPQLILLAVAGATLIWNQRREQAAKQKLGAETG